MKTRPRQKVWSCDVRVHSDGGRIRRKTQQSSEETFLCEAARGIHWQMCKVWRFLWNRDTLTSLDWTPGVSRLRGRRNVNAGFRSFSLWATSAWIGPCSQSWWVGLDVCVGVCGDSRSDSSSFRKKPRSPGCHNTSDSVSCLSLFSCRPSLSSSFTGDELIETDWWNYRSHEQKRVKIKGRTRSFFPSAVHRGSTSSLVSFLCAGYWPEFRARQYRVSWFDSLCGCPCSSDDFLPSRLLNLGDLLTALWGSFPFDETVSTPC